MTAPLGGLRHAEFSVFPSLGVYIDNAKLCQEKNFRDTRKTTLFCLVIGYLIRSEKKIFFEQTRKRLITRFYDAITLQLVEVWKKTGF